jgi:putative ABC transport system permease protein
MSFSGFILVRKNLFRRPFRSLILVVCMAVVVGLQTASGIVEKGVTNGFDLAVKRLGADLVAVPDEYTEVMERAFITGEAALYYMDQSVEEKIASFDFVEYTSSQVYVKSLSGASCCSAGNIFIIGYEPQTDFTIKPWLSKNAVPDIGPSGLIAGSAFNLKAGDKLKFFGHDYEVKGILEATGSGLDVTAFIPIDTAYQMAYESREKAEQELNLERGDISAVMIKLKPELAGGVPLKEAVYELTKGVYEISVMEPQKMLKRIHSNMSATIYGLRAAGLAIWPTTILLIGLVFAMSVNERKREMGLMRAVGATRNYIFLVVVSEALIIIATGTLVGVIVSLGILAGFSRLIASALEVTFYWPSFEDLAGRMMVISVLSIISGCAAAAFPAFMSARLEPYEAVRNSG